MPIAKSTIMYYIEIGRIVYIYISSSIFVLAKLSHRLSPSYAPLIKTVTPSSLMPPPLCSISTPPALIQSFSPRSPSLHDLEAISPLRTLRLCPNLKPSPSPQPSPTSSLTSPRPQSPSCPHSVACMWDTKIYLCRIRKRNSRWCMYIVSARRAMIMCARESTSVRGYQRRWV